MATFTWTKGSGNWDIGANWGATSAPGTNPLQHDIAVIGNLAPAVPIP